jgi:subtilisin family serine protease
MRQVAAAKHKINRSVLFAGILAMVFWGLVASIELAEAEGPVLTPEASQAIQALSENPKLIAAKDILKDFTEGKSRSRVIVNLHTPAEAVQLKNFADMAVRQELRRAVREAQDAVIGRMDPVAVVITNRFTYQFGFSADVTLEGLQALVDDSHVLSIEPDTLLHAHLAQGIPLMNALDPRSDYDGSGISIAICDTGIDYTHSRLGGGILPPPPPPVAGEAGNSFPNTKVIGGYDFGDDDPDPMDQHGHGTACAGIAAGALGTVGDYIGGVAYNAKLYALKISYGSGGSAYTSDMIEAWEWCITHQHDDPNNPIMIISTSFGGGRYFSSCDSQSPARTAAAASAVAAGMTLFVSSGNDGYCDAMGAPACISHVISVGAVYDAHFTSSAINWCVSQYSCATKYETDGCTSGWYSPQIPYADNVIVYSNTASFLDLLAPSNWATTTKRGGGYWDVANGFGGTSAACPYAAGAAACLQSAARAITGAYLTPAQVKSTLTDTGDLITDGKVSITKPRVNLGRAVDSLEGASIVYVDPSGACSGYTPCSSTIQGAIHQAAANATIKIAGGTYPENVTLDTDKELIFEGGYNATYSAQSGETRLQAMTITRGAAVINRLTFDKTTAAGVPADGF